MNNPLPIPARLSVSFSHILSTVPASSLVNLFLDTEMIAKYAAIKIFFSSTVKIHCITSISLFLSYLFALS